MTEQVWRWRMSSLSCIFYSCFGVLYSTLVSLLILGVKGIKYLTFFSFDHPSISLFLIFTILFIMVSFNNLLYKCFFLLLFIVLPKKSLHTHQYSLWTLLYITRFSFFLLLMRWEWLMYERYIYLTTGK